MPSNPLSEALGPDFQSVFGALRNDQCRTMLENLDRPMTASEIATRCDLPKSTVYQKLEQMVDAGLLVKHERRGEQSVYTVGFDEVVVETGPGKLELSIVARRRSASEQLSELWTEVRSESTDSD